ncbi:MAG: uracil-DNA glycosylase family protein [Bacteroidaceae bacterium]|nr:uracil-DNA glycosylase family protein [Bacteroidaceae bacterium]
MSTAIPVEKHPLEPFLPEGAKILMLGSFPPKRERWSMEWFYPNKQNDMWRIMGHLFYGDKDYFVVPNEKRFDKDRIVQFCTAQGIALYDTASEVRRLRDNASDKFLEVVTPTDIVALLGKLPDCRAVVTTGQKATDIAVLQLGCEEPVVGGVSLCMVNGRQVRMWRMPSTSRAYPLPLEKKADVYHTMLCAEGLLLEGL